MQLVTGAYDVADPEEERNQWREYFNSFLPEEDSVTGARAINTLKLWTEDTKREPYLQDDPPKMAEAALRAASLAMPKDVFSDRTLRTRLNNFVKLYDETINTLYFDALINENEYDLLLQGLTVFLAHQVYQLPTLYQHGELDESVRPYFQARTDSKSIENMNIQKQLRLFEEQRTWGS